ncbi:MAG: ABC transporter ATP-binding protein, partial [Alphaproteobacteria bacterium]|nr:ABC transporter ATP-binding protein [Alphaproteobacteria bacterium]
MSDPLLRVAHLKVDGQLPNDNWAPIVKDVSLEVYRGEVLALIGESGAGKSTIGRAALGYARPGCRIVGGTVMLDGVDVLALGPRARRDFRGRRVAYVAQSAAAAFNAALAIGDQVTEAPVAHRVMSKSEAVTRAIRMYARMQLPDSETIGEKYPHQVSGGQLQRLMAVMAMSCSPDLLVLDEPTTAIDVTTQPEVLPTFKRVIAEEGTAAIFVSHNLAVVAQMADRIIVLRNGEIVEHGGTEQILHAPRADYTKQLMAAVQPPPKATAARLVPDIESVRGDIVLEVAALDAGYGAREGQRPKRLALSGVNVKVPRAQVLGVIGESGCGKSTLARVIAGSLVPTAGEIRFNGKPIAARVRQRDMTTLRAVQIVLQTPDVSFNPKKKILEAIGRPLKFYFNMNGAQRRSRVEQLLRMVELPPEYADRYPRELSGCEKQRVNLARALAAQPQVLLCDEVTSSLDTVVGAAII